MHDALKVFVSYSSKQRTEVEAFASDLRDLGHLPWIDQRLTSGQLWWDEILKQIRECDLFVFAFSPDSDQSEACRTELKYASGLRRRILPVKVAAISDNLLPREAMQIQSLDYCNADKDAYKALQRSLLELPDADALPESLPEPPPIPVSYVSDLKMQLDAGSLSPDAQRLLVAKLEERAGDTDDREDVLKLAQRFKRQPDLLAAVAERLTALIERLEKRRGESIRRRTQSERPKPPPSPPPVVARQSSDSGFANVFKWIGIVVVGLIVLGLLGMCEEGF